MLSPNALVDGYGYAWDRYVIGIYHISRNDKSLTSLLPILLLSSSTISCGDHLERLAAQFATTFPPFDATVEGLPNEFVATDAVIASALDGICFALETDEMLYAVQHIPARFTIRIILFKIM